MRGSTHPIDKVDNPRRRQPQRSLSMRAVAGVVLFVFVTMVLHGNWLLALMLMCGGFGLWQVAEALRHHRERDAVLHDVVMQSDEEFLGFAADLLRAQGYGVLKTGYTDDRHGNFLVMYGNESLACRVLRGRRRLYRPEMVRILAQMKLYGCRGSLIVTNRAASWGAAHFARRVGCVLIDRDELIRLILQYRQGHRVYLFQRAETTKLRRRK
ncbi:MAG: restriction endonuclease [Deltaproteobacteria bacterium]|nr:restriction endonuclease [Deltaproteobacteria bacterium]